MSKGSKRRPSKINYEEFKKRWDKIFKTRKENDRTK